MEIRSSFSQIIPYFPAELQTALLRIPKAPADSIRELRLRIGKTLHAVCGISEYTVTGQGGLAAEPASGFTVTADLLDCVFRNLCEHSVHSYRDMIRSGFLTAAGGCRAGICGTAVCSDAGRLDTVRCISSINLRIASERIGCADAITAALHEPEHSGGVLLAGAPGSGKTTLLRDYARFLGSSRRVCLLDERGELAAVRNGKPQFSLGLQTDVFDGYPKADAVSIAVRVMTPDVLICDELGDEAEIDALLQSMHTGVRLIASAHAATGDELLRRPQIRRLIQAGVFDTAVMLGNASECGSIREIISLPEDI